MIASALPTDQILIPKFTVQPLVENSIIHGSYPHGADIRIAVSVHQQGEILILKIQDNGRGCDPQLLNRYLSDERTELSVNGGFGIRNVNERIHLNFGPGSGLSFALNEENQLIAVLTLDWGFYRNKMHIG